MYRHIHAHGLHSCTPTYICGPPVFQSTTFFVYAGLEGLALVVFVLLTLQYTYETYGMDVVVEVDSQDDSEEGNQKGHDNYAFENGDLKPVGTGIALQKDHEVTVAKF